MNEFLWPYIKVRTKLKVSETKKLKVHHHDISSLMLSWLVWNSTTKRRDDRFIPIYFSRDKPKVDKNMIFARYITSLSISCPRALIWLLGFDKWNHLHLSLDLFTGILLLFSMNLILKLVFHTSAFSCTRRLIKKFNELFINSGDRM